MTITLVVRPDHSFVQSLQTRSGRINEVKGKWWLDGDKIVEFDSFLDFLNDERGEGGTGMGGTGFRPERWPGGGVMMGPIIVKCPESGYKVDYVK